MSAKRVSKATLAGAATRKVALPDSLTEKLQTATETRVRARLGLAPGAPLPEDLRKLIAEQVASVGAPRITSKVAGDVQSSLSLIGTAGSIQRLKDNLGSAREAMEAIAAAREVDEILKRRADLLAKKRVALEAAGFTTDQAMQIILADLAAAPQP